MKGSLETKYSSFSTLAAEISVRLNRSRQRIDNPAQWLDFLFYAGW